MDRRGYVDTIAVPKDSPWIAYATFGGAVRLWNPDSGTEHLLGHGRATSNLVSGAPSHSVLFGTDAGFVELWDAAEEKISQRYDLR